MEVAVVGSDQFVLGFKLAGVRRTYAVPPEQMESRLAEVMAEKGVGIVVLLNEEFTKLPGGLRRKLVNSVEPVVISIGKVEEVDLRERIKQAIGVDLWK